MDIERSTRAVWVCGAACVLLSVLGGSVGCSSEVKVQRVMYEAPSEREVSSDPDQPLPPAQRVVVDEPRGEGVPDSVTSIESMKRILESIYDRDAQLVSSTLNRSSGGWTSDPNRAHLGESIAKIDRENGEKLKEIIEVYGWPTRQVVGIKAVQGAYIAVQHANHDPDFQASCLAMIEEQVERGELPGAFLALMTDRVAVSQSNPQVYGTQMTMAPDAYGVMQAVPSVPIGDVDRLDERRAALGMPAHVRFIDAIEVAYFEAVGIDAERVSTVPGVDE